VKRKKNWAYINPIKRKPKPLGVVVAFDIETRQIPVNEQISTYTIKEKSVLLFGSACAYVHRDILKKKGLPVLESELGFQRQVGKYFLHDELLFEDKQTFTKWILSLAKKFSQIYVYAHNITFDIRESVDFSMLRKEGYEITVFNPQVKQFIIRFVKKIGKKRKKVITFTDTLNLYPASLEEVGETIGLIKLEKELGLDRSALDRAIEEGRYEDVLKYNVRDTQITANAVIIREEVVNQLGGQLRLTNPSTAMDLFRRRFLKKGIKKPSRQLRDFIRKSYFGGRTEVFFRGVVTTPEYYDSAMKLYERKKRLYNEYGFLTVQAIRYVDVNSLYPYSMKYFPSPIKEIGMYGREGVKAVRRLYDLGLIIEFDVLHPLKSIYEAWKKQIRWLRKERPDIDWNKIEKFIEKYKNSDELLKYRDYFATPVLYITEATVLVEKKPITETVTPLPVKYSDKLVFPQGVIRGVWTQFELSLINPPKDTKILEVHTVLLFEADWLFIEYVDTFYEIKTVSKKKGDRVMYQVAKLFMNSLYGKWAERKRKTVTLSREEFLAFIISMSTNLHGNFSFELALDADYGVIRTENTQINVLGGYYEVKLKEYYEPYNVAISTFITSIARSVLRAYMYLVKENKGYVFYCDTDSLIVDENGFQALKPFIDKYRLGYLDEEIENIAFVEINTLKDYKVFVPKEPSNVVKEEKISYIRKITMKIKNKEKVSYFYYDEKGKFWVKYKLKGVSLKKAKVLSDEDDRAFAVERLAGVREFLKYKQFGLYWIEQRKELKRKYEKAFRADGWVEPFYLKTNNFL